ncbi:MAG: adenylyltransferase/cytidyltransferase family protein [Candidatus Omnitrophica bacterium]|nr:adenylyltransferase/cytidyltransferase family protein [Candidatus Omnitrophota bacterium]
MSNVSETLPPVCSSAPTRRVAQQLDLDELAERLAVLKSEGKKIVLCHGVFDLLHIGHIRYLDQAKRLGSVLVVTVTPDQFVNKGPHRPVFSEQLRCEALAALHCVDWVAINRWPMAVETIRLLRPDYYVKGPDYRQAGKDVTGGITLEEEAVKSVGGRLVFTEDAIFSASHLINRYLPVFPKAVADYLSGFRSRYTAEDIAGFLERAKTLKVLVVGEAIIDDYHYCEQVGKSAKEPVLVARYLSSEQFAGGSLAIANHLANFCDHVGLVTCLGRQRSYERFIRRRLHPNIEPRFLYVAKAPTIVKRRFMEQYLSQKLFELYEMHDEPDAALGGALCAQLQEALPRYDAVIVADYGHGMMLPEATELVCSQTRFLAVNTQANAGNRGLHTVSKYRRADYISLARHELVLEERNRRSDLEDMILNVSQKLSCPRVLITCGKDGNVAYSRGEGFFRVPALATQVVDRMGAGDAVIALTTLCVAQQAPMELVGFLGNVVGAEAVATMGHRSTIERIPLIKHISSLLK